MLVAEHESLVTQVEKLADPRYQSVDKEDRLSDLVGKHGSRAEGLAASREDRP